MYNRICVSSYQHLSTIISTVLYAYPHILSSLPCLSFCLHSPFPPYFPPFHPLSHPLSTAFGFVFAFSKVLVSMSSSALFPKFLNWTCGKYKSPYTAILAGSLLSYILCLIVYFYPMLNNYLYNISILSAFIAYISQFIGFIIFKFKYSLQDRKFTSPLGIYGAVYGILVFTMAAIGVLAFQNDSGVSAIFITTLIALYTLYYFLYARKRQTFSAEEKKIFFPVHIVKCKLI